MDAADSFAVDCKVLGTGSRYDDFLFLGKVTNCPEILL